jgi:poly-gamma-glutamate capsule biosynthesis protein CapA/YwtB (metallophosphatase superfamily)
MKLKLISFFICFICLAGKHTFTQDSTISIIGVGDIMPGTNFPNITFLPPNNDCMALFNPVLPYLQEADLAFGNLEACFLDSGKVFKTCNDTTNCYAFRMPTHYAECLKKAGFNLLSLANNHIYDFGPLGVCKTVNLLDSLHIYHAGLLAYPTSIFRIKNIRLGFCAFSPFTGTCDILDTLQAEKIVRQLADTCDIVILSMHAGGEGKEYERVLKGMEIFLEEERGDTYHFAHRMIDAGADIIFGHGPHVIRAIELYRERLICYSLGNFCTYGRFNLNGPNGIAPIVSVMVDKQGKFLHGKITAVKQAGEGGPVPDYEKRAIYAVKRLTRTDFPETPIVITNEGEINIK